MNESVKLFKALGDTTRLALVTELLPNPQSVTELVDKLGKSQPAVSIALQKLASAQIVTAEKQGTTVIYTLNPKVKQILKAVEVIK